MVNGIVSLISLSALVPFKETCEELVLIVLKILDRIDQWRHLVYQVSFLEVFFPPPKKDLLIVVKYT